MVTPLDASFGLIGKFSLIISFVFVIVVMYGILAFTKAFGNNKGLQIFIAFLIGLFVLLMPGMSEVIRLWVPWLAILMIIIIFLLLFFKMFGATDEHFLSVVKNYPGVYWTIIAVVLLSALWAITHVYHGYYDGSPTGAEPGEGGLAERGPITRTFGQVFFHPTVLGVVFIFLFAVFMIGILAAESK